VRKPLCAHQDHQTPVARRVLRGTAFVLGLAVAAALSGCPGGAELENPDRFRQYDAATAGVGRTTGGAGMAATGGMAVAGTAGGAGTGATYVWDCAVDVNVALQQNCGRSNCHAAPTALQPPYADLELTTVEKAREMVNKPASYADIGCNGPGEPWRECGPTELPDGCVPGRLLINPINFEDSWVLRKMNALTKLDLSCGELMPVPPGNAATYGWDANGVRKQCFIELFRSLAAPQ
jgi:hypothetical protein